MRPTATAVLDGEGLTAQCGGAVIKAQAELCQCIHERRWMEWCHHGGHPFVTAIVLNPANKAIFPDDRHPTDIRTAIYDHVRTLLLPGRTLPPAAAAAVHTTTSKTSKGLC